MTITFETDQETGSYIMSLPEQTRKNIIELAFVKYRADSMNNENQDETE